MGGSDDGSILEKGQREGEQMAWSPVEEEAGQ